MIELMYNAYHASNQKDLFYSPSNMSFMVHVLFRLDICGLGEVEPG